MEIKYCACGCNKIVKPKNTYINGHNKPTLGRPSDFKGKCFEEMYGKEKGNEISKKIRISKIGDKNPAKRPEVREIISKNRKGKLTGDENPKYWKNKKNVEQSKRMELNNPLFNLKTKEKRRKYMLNKFYETGDIKIGNNETQILNEIEKITNFVIERQHRVIGYSIDGYILELNLAIEIDERHHYYTTDGSLRPKDIERQKRIEEALKCKFLRIKNNINYDELKTELQKLK
jgi:very-short-patch-repair endonuclease